MFKYDPLEYEMPWRPNYEARVAVSWAVSGISALGVSAFTSMPIAPFYWISSIAAGMCISKLPSVYRLHRIQRNLGGRDLAFVKLPELQKVIGDSGESSLDCWLGYGFDWQQTHTQRVFEILKRDWSTLTRELQKKKVKKLEKKGLEMPIGQPWIHGVEPKEEKIVCPMKHLEGHTLIIGTTGSGKTRAFDLLITQAILRGECVIIIDPKGDKEMMMNAKRACDAMGQSDRFVKFHPAFPNESCRINPLANYTRVTELASRIAALMQTESGSDPFKAFSWQALNNVAQALHIIEETITLIKMRRNLEGGASGLLCNAIETYLDKVNPGWKKNAKAYMRPPKNADVKGEIDMDKLPLDRKAKGLTAYYYAEVSQTPEASTDLEGLLSMNEHDQTHFGKMVASLLPILAMLTSGEIGKMLSPDYADVDDLRLITDTSSIIDNKQVAYFGLDSLTDTMVSSALGSILLADMGAVSGDRYNFGQNNLPVNVFVDEAAEAINDPFIQLLNKGRGAGIRLTVATQTFSDFCARLGSEDKAYQVLGNINNMITLRCIDTTTQEYVTKNLPMTRVSYVMRTQGQNTDGNEPILHGGNQGERLMEEESELFPPQLLGMLPNLEYIAKVSGGRIIKGRFPILIGE